MNNQDRIFTITTEDGREVKCEILFTHHSDDFNKDYVVFVEEGTNEAHASVFVEEGDGQGHLEQVQTDEEWEMLEDLLQQFSEEQDGHAHGCGCGCDSCDGECDDEECDCDGDSCDCDHHHE